MGPEHSYLHDAGRVVYEPVVDEEAMEALQLLARTEASSRDRIRHALAGAMRVGRELGPDGIILVNLSGRGDKDMTTAATWFDYFDEGAVQV